jgi:Leucine-rich repeat (LRR) protein
MNKNIILFISLFFSGIIMAQLPSNSFFKFEFTNGSLNNTSSSGAPNFSGSIISIADRNASANDAAEITGSLGGASVGAANVNEMTLSFWMKHDPIAVTSNERILQIYGTGGNGFRLQMDGNQLLYNGKAGNSASPSNTASELVNIDDTIWHHIAIRTTLRGSSDTLEFDVFLDNVIQPNLSNTTINVSGAITNFLMNANLVISPTNNYSGDIDDIYFYKSALTDAEIAQIYFNNNSNCTVTIPDANFKAYLVGNTAINTNGNIEIECSEATAFTGNVNCQSLSISDLTGIEAFTNILYLYCNNNNLTSLDISNSLDLLGLRCNSNQLSLLDISNNSDLTELLCQDNNLLSLNVTNLTDLETFRGQTNQITTLDFSLASNLTSVNCGYNNLSYLNFANGNNSNIISFNSQSNPNLTCIQVDNVTYSTTTWTNIDAASSFSTNCGGASCIVTIPDANFKAYLVGNATINTNGDTEIQCSEASAFTGTINCSSLSISNLTGIEAFTALNSLLCYSNALTTLDISANTALTSLNCYNTQLTSLDISNNTALTSLLCYNNQLTSLDISSNIGLTEVFCNNNPLTNINVGFNSLLLKLVCNNTQLTSLDISQNTGLTELRCADNSISSLNLSNNTNLIKLYCNDNSLNGLDVSQNTNLEYLFCNNNISLSSINVSLNTSLQRLDFSNTSISNLDVSLNSALIRLVCTQTGLSNLDLSNNGSLNFFNCSNNSLNSLNIANGNNSNFTFFNASSNSNLTCIEVDDIAYSTSNWTNIDATTSFSTNCIVLVSSITVQGQAGATTITTQGGTLQMEATILPANADDATYTWSVMDGSGTATIDVNGLLTAITDGTVTVIAAANDASNTAGTITITISNQTTTGINELTAANLSIYPNPTSSEITFSNIQSKIESIAIINIRGKAIKTVIPTNNIIDVSDLTKGIYFLQIQTENEIINSKFIKK